MKRMVFAGAALVAGLMVAGVPAVFSAQGDKVSDEQRQEIIDSFDRIRLNTTPGDAMMLRILVEASGAQHGVEVGSATGYGAINMGIAFERTGGHLDTLEIDEEMVRVCNENIKKMGLEDTVTCIEGDALKTIPQVEGPIDFAFIDAMKTDYLKYLKLMEPKLKVGAVIVADNVIKSARSMPDYLDYVQNSGQFDTVIIRASEEKGDGMAITYKIK